MEKIERDFRGAYGGRAFCRRNVWKEKFDPEFSINSVAVSKALASEYADIAGKYGCTYLDAASVAAPGAADQEHMDAVSHGRLAESIYEKVKTLV